MNSSREAALVAVITCPGGLVTSIAAGLLWDPLTHHPGYPEQR